MDAPGMWRDRCGRQIRCLSALLVLCALWTASGCKSPAEHRKDADETAYRIIEHKQSEALGRTEPFTIETPADSLRRRLFADQQLPASGPGSLGADQLPRIEHWPEEQPSEEESTPDAPAAPAAPTAPWQGPGPLKINLFEALQIGARNSRDYQSRKENVFLVALDLDLERDDFRNTYAGLLESLLSADMTPEDTVAGVDNTFTAGWSRRLESGATLSSRLIIDVAKLLTMDKASAFGIFADATISIPLLRGAGRHIVTEPMTQAERNVLYEIWSFERFKRVFAVTVARQYLQVLQQADQVKNAANNYRRLVASAQRARALADEGRLSEIQVDQARQDELRARDRWIAAQQNLARDMDSFKITLGLPPDANVELDNAELERLAETAKGALGRLEEYPMHRTEDDQIHLLPPAREAAGPLELPEPQAVQLAFEHRVDLQTAHGGAYDAQRRVVVTADALQAGLTLIGSASAGERRSLGTADEPDGQFRPERGFYSLGLDLDLPWERTAERNAYRESLINLQAAVRNVQDLEDRIKQDIRQRLRSLEEAREGIRIQSQAVRLAERRVESTKLFLEAGDAEIRDVLEAEESLVEAQDALTNALVDYRVAELELQQDMGVLQVDAEGLWHEFESQPDGAND